MSASFCCLNLCGRSRILGDITRIMNLRFSIYRRRSTPKRLFHRLLGLAIWTVPVAMGLAAILGPNLIPWGLGILGVIVVIFGGGLIWYTRMEPEAVVISDSEIYTEVNGGRRSEFPIEKITQVTLDGRGVSLQGAGQTLILADRDFTPDAWIELKQALRDTVLDATVRVTKNEPVTPPPGSSHPPAH